VTGVYAGTAVLVGLVWLLAVRRRDRDTDPRPTLGQVIAEAVLFLIVVALTFATILSMLPAAS
jgi:hypothetical protein